MYTPAYRNLYHSGELQRRAALALARLSQCTLCPRACSVDRSNDNVGFCRVGRYAPIASFHPHFGEEAPLVGEHGSGTIFFAGCSLGCVFCQNHEISQPASIQAVSQLAMPDELAGVMLDLERQGCHNINLVTPSHVVPQILEALVIACKHGLNLPLVFNSGGYDEVETLRFLDGVVDIYMPDVKIWDARIAGKLLLASDYPEKARDAVTEMHRQGGDLSVDANGLAQRGLLVRHLVLPENLSGSSHWAHFAANDISEHTYINVMDQYHPCFDANEHFGTNRHTTHLEYENARIAMAKAGLRRLEKRPGNQILNHFLPH